MYDPDNLDELDALEQAEKRWRRTDIICLGVGVVLVIAIILSWWIGA